MTERSAIIADFLAANGWTVDALRPLASDASFRRYHRLSLDRQRAVLMDAPPSHEDVEPFARIARHLRALGLSAPEIYAADFDAGLLLLEDLGDETFTRHLASGGNEAALYALAVDVLAHIHRLPAARAIPPDLPRYDRQRLIDEALLLVDWHLPAILGAASAPALRAAYIAAWEAVLPTVLSQPPTLVLRDYHVDNLMLLPNRSGLAACGLLDFQDAVAGPAAYDLMSLLEDARRDIAEALRAEMIERYQNGIARGEPADFAASYAVLAAQRHAKVIGIFVRLSRRDRKHGYLAHIPRVWRLLERSLAHPALAPVDAWFSRHVAREHRIAPQPEAVAP